ncbi:MAG: hypothetical protein C0601_06400 [Candidatus Muiribacterium halophilum]|uniref:TonB-dependent receptor plug domain-containing protein n=1 Tax=Muiribacterium halophilum TaxID=2053465 RepID=A0A2N5ZG27_MUIH1|nr:MAG: hypothetical protein C0601_06400 [Candidatus Muirbacterium halophilum]
MKKIIVAIFLVLIITQIFALQKKSFEMGRVSIIGKVKKDRSNISKDVYSVDSLFESAQIKDSLIDSSLTVRNLGSVGSLLTATLKGAKSPQTAKMFDGVLLNSPANGDFDISWIEKEMLSSIKIEYSPFFMNSSGSGSGGMIDFSGLNHTPNILGISLGSEKYKKHYINTMIDDFTTLFISNKEYRGGSSLERGRQNSIYIKKNKERFKTSLWYADRTQYLLGPSTFLTPGNYNDSTLFVYSLRSSPVKEIEYGLSAVIEKNSLYEKNLDTMSPTSTKRYNVFFNRDFNDLKVKLTYEKFIGKSEQFADTDFDGLWDTKRGYDKEEDLYSVSMRKSLSPFLILTGKYYSREDEDYQEFTILKDFDDHSKIVIGNRYNSPTFNDLYWPNSGFTKGNPLLKSETSGFV